MVFVVTVSFNDIVQDALYEGEGVEVSYGRVAELDASAEWDMSLFSACITLHFFCV